MYRPECVICTVLYLEFIFTPLDPVSAYKKTTTRLLRKATESSIAAFVKRSQYGVCLSVICFHCNVSVHKARELRPLKENGFDSWSHRTSVASLTTERTSNSASQSCQFGVPLEKTVLSQLTKIAYVWALMIYRPLRVSFMAIKQCGKSWETHASHAFTPLSLFDLENGDVYTESAFCFTSIVLVLLTLDQFQNKIKKKTLFYNIYLFI